MQDVAPSQARSATRFALRTQRLKFAKESKTFVESKDVVAYRSSLEAFSVTGAAPGWSLDLPRRKGSGRGLQCVFVQIPVTRLIYLVAAGCTYCSPSSASVVHMDCLPGSSQELSFAGQARACNVAKAWTKVRLLRICATAVGSRAGTSIKASLIVY